MPLFSAILDASVLQTGSCSVLAVVDVPSYSTFPWLGIGIWLAFSLVALVGFGATLWVRETVDDLSMTEEALWPLFFSGTCLLLLTSTLLVGPLAIPVVGCFFAVELWRFFRKRDAVVAANRRFLGRGGLANILSEVRTFLRRSLPEKEARSAPVSLRNRLRQLGESLKRSAVKPSSRKSGATQKPSIQETAAAVLEERAFTFLKKDGTPAIVVQPGKRGSVSANVRNAQKMLADAMRAEATDLHFEPHEHDYVVRLRVDGILSDSDRIPASDGKAVVSALKVVADMNIAERRRPQDGTFSVQFGGDKYDIRVASTPTSYGEKVVLRLLQTSGGILKSGLDGIGLRKQTLEKLREIIHRPYGMFLVAGPTGSGKTTTVYASLSEIDAKQHNITTIEDPVEYRLDNITQIAVNTQADVSFANILRSVLRQDPDVLLVGEIRDRETAEIACQAAMTGHFVFTTLHANDAVATITRLLDLGLEPALLQSAVTAVLGQRLARRLCMKCREPCEPPPGLTKKFGLKPDAIKHIYKEKGCPSCEGTGFRGRIGIHELMVLNDDIRNLLTEQPSVNAIKAAAVANGTMTLQIDGLLKVIQGQTSVSEVLRVTN